MISKAQDALFLTCIFVISFRLVSFAQDTEKGNFATQATDPHARPDARRMGPKQKKIYYIIKSNPQGTLNGNPCFKEASEKFGFQYLVAPEGVTPNRNGFSRSMHNLGVNIVLFFRNGPFWKARMKKKLKHCKYGYGDFVG